MAQWPLRLTCLNESPYEKVGKCSYMASQMTLLLSLNESPYEKVGKSRKAVKIAFAFSASMKVPTKK